MSISMKSFGVIGLGKLGLSIAVGLSAQGRLAWAMNRGAELRNAAKFLLPPSLPIYASVNAIERLPTTLVIAVSDSAIEQVAEEVAGKFGSQLSDIAIIHCSGAKTRAVLASCEALGAFTMSLHPYQSFGIATAKNFKDIAWGMELPPNEPFRTISEQFAQDMVHTLGGKAIPLQATTLENKPLYHASAVFAANYMSVLVAAAAQTAVFAGIAPELFLPQILQKSLDNALAGLKSSSAKFSLTGPISRADMDTVRDHITSFHRLAEGKGVLFVRPYCLFGIATAEFACAQGLITAEQKQTFVEFFDHELRAGH